MEDAADYLEQPVDHVEACLRSYVDYRDEVDEWIERGRVARERERDRFQRQREALA